MRLKSLNIRNFKNLRDFRIDFTQESFFTVLVGRNGTGKSNILEALIIIFRDLDLGDPPTFAYQLEYACRGSEISVDADPERSKEPQIMVDEKILSAKDFSRKGGGNYLPKFVFGYYSGPSNRMESHFEKHQHQFADDLLDGKDEPLRPLLYARLVHSQFVLLSFFESAADDLGFLKEHLRIEDLDSVLFVLKKPYWYNPNRRTPDEDPGDSRFWEARGVVKTFLGRLYAIALSPLRTKQKQSRGTATDRLYLYVKDRNDLMRLAKEYKNRQEFFKALESMYISDLVEDVRTRVKIRGVDESLTFRELSEGEQQLLTVLGLLRFIKDDEALFLLDEPDTHLNPAWSLEYVRLLREAIEEPETSQVVMATHDPLVVANLSRTEVLLMQRNDDGRAFASHPEEDPKGMGIDGLLTSDIYGLRSALDLETLQKLERKRELAIQEELTLIEKAELADLDQQLAELDFTKTVRDPMYKLFVEAMTEIERRDGLQVTVLSKDEIERQRSLASEVLRQIKSSQE
jgi:predicted ATPase